MYCITLYMAVKRNTAIPFSRAPRPSFRRTGTHVMLKIELVKGAAKDASPERRRNVEEIYLLWDYYL